MAEEERTFKVGQLVAFERDGHKFTGTIKKVLWNGKLVIIPTNQGAETMSNLDC